MLPVYMKDSVFKEPQDNVYVLVAANGTFLVKKMGLYSASVRLEGSNLDLLNHTEEVTKHFARIPRPLMCKVFGFFRAAFYMHGGEAIVFLYYSKDRHSFAVKAPPQRVSCTVGRWGMYSHCHVAYDACERPPEYVKLGTIHSHANSVAFHSCTDDADEKHDDGLHITFGRVDAARPDVSVSFVVNGRRFYLEPEEVLAGIQDYAPLPPPPSWMRNITCIFQSDWHARQHNMAGITRIWPTSYNRNDHRWD